MSLESFIGLETDQPMSESAFEAFKERMKAASAQIAAIKKEEKKHKKKEDELLKILLKFVKSSQNKDLVLLISRALEQDIPAGFVLSIILLNNKEVLSQVGDGFLLASPKNIQDEVRQSMNSDNTENEAKSLTFFNQEDQSMPLKVKIQLDTWMKGLMYQASETPQKLIKNAYDIEFKDEDKKRTIKPALIQLVAYVIRDYLDDCKLSESFIKIKEFTNMILKGILTKTEESFENRRMLES